MVGKEEIACLQLAARQDGVLSVRQAKDAGLSKDRINWRVRKRLWNRCHPGVVRIGGSPRSWQQDLRALSLWLGRGFVLSHATAAALHGFARFKEGPLEATGSRKMRAPSGVVLHQQEVDRRDVDGQRGLRFTTPTRTLLDVAAFASQEDLRATCDEALRRRLTTLAKLEQLLQRTSSWGVGALRAIVTEYVGGEAPTESELEARAVDFLEQHDFPKPTKQRCVTVGGQRRRLDLTFDAERVVVEVDGYSAHSGLREFEDDRRRNNALQVRGFVVLHWTHRALSAEPERLARELRTALTHRARHSAEHRSRR